MIVLDSGTVSPRAASTSTGNLPIGQSLSRSARVVASTVISSKGVAFS